MKILHTADWHLGKKLDRFSRLEEQIAVLKEIETIADEHGVDMIIIAGDLFDNANPSIETLELFYGTLKRMAKDSERPVIAIAGNHDSPSLIDAPDVLARTNGIILIGYPNATVKPLSVGGFTISESAPGYLALKLNHIDFPVRILHTPYANELRLKTYLGEDKDAGINEALGKMWQNLAATYCDENGVNLLTAHLYMNKRGSALIDEPDGEKPIKVGNAELIYTDIIPSQIQYTALGHIHGYKNIGSETKPIVYSSAPIAYSFSEAGQQKYVHIITATPNQNVAIESVPLTAGKSLARVTFDNIVDAETWLKEHPDYLVELTYESDTYMTAAERNTLFNAHNGIVYLIPKIAHHAQEEQMMDKQIDLSKQIEDLFVDYFQYKQGGQVPNEELMDLFKAILKD